MKITLTKDLEKFVSAKVRSGGYADASEVVREALRTFRSKDDPAEADSQGLAELLLPAVRRQTDRPALRPASPACPAQTRESVRLALQQSDYFWADLLKQVDWYREQATAEIASVASTPFKRRCTNS